MNRVAKACFIAFALLLVVAPLAACGGPAPPPTPPPTPTAKNQPPVITSLTAEATTLLLNKETKITCNVSEPDGDKLTFKWEANGGTILGTTPDNSAAFWKAPDFTGKFIVKVTVSDKDGADYKSLELSVQANRPPVISSLTPVPAKLQRGETSTITCLASDPDNDELTYTWKVSGDSGSITGTGKTVTWKAPNSLGNFEIKVTVEDGKGGTANSSCSIVVATPELTVILTPVLTPLAESGTVPSSGAIDPSSFRIGDNAQNYGVRPYFSYDISGLLASAEIKQATLNFTERTTIGTPFLSTPYLFVDRVDYGVRALQGGDFSLPIMGQVAKYDSQPPREINVISYLKDALQYQKPRLQFRLRLGLDQNFNSKDDYIEFSKVELTVVYTK